MLKVTYIWFDGTVIGLERHLRGQTVTGPSTPHEDHPVRELILESARNGDRWEIEYLDTPQEDKLLWESFVFMMQCVSALNGGREVTINNRHFHLLGEQEVSIPEIFWLFNHSLSQIRGSVRLVRDDDTGVVVEITDHTGEVIDLTEKVQ